MAAEGAKGKADGRASKKVIKKGGRAEAPEAPSKPKVTKAPKKPGPENAKPEKPKPEKPKPGKPKLEATPSEVETKGKSVRRSRIRDSGRIGRGDDSSDKTVTPELDPFEVAKKTMKGSVPAIVNAMVELAKQGSCSHAKTLLEMTGANHMFDGDAEMHGSGESWAKLVLERLDEAESGVGEESGSTQEESRELVAGRC